MYRWEEVKSVPCVHLISSILFEIFCSRRFQHNMNFPTHVWRVKLAICSVSAEAKQTAAESDGNQFFCYYMDWRWIHFCIQTDRHAYIKYINLHIFTQRSQVTFHNTLYSISSQGQLNTNTLIHQVTRRKEIWNDDNLEHHHQEPNGDQLKY